MDDCRGTSRWVVAYIRPDSPYPRYFHWDDRASPSTAAEAVEEMGVAFPPDVSIVGVYERVPGIGNPAPPRRE